MKNYTYPALIICLLIALLFFAQRCHVNSKNANSAFIALNDTIAYFKNSLGTQTTSIKTIQLQESQLKKVILDKDKELALLSKQFAHIKTIIKYTQVTKYDTINVTFKDSLPSMFNRHGTVHNSWYYFKYRITNNGFSLDSLTIPNEAIIITGFKRKWLFGKEILVTDVTNTNPYITIKTMQSVHVAVPAPWHKKWYVWLGVGVAGGFLMAK